jgi:hypothetical protein
MIFVTPYRARDGPLQMFTAAALDPRVLKERE